MESWEDTALVTMNMAGRFSGQEIKRYGQQVIKHIVTEKNLGLFFGQQTNFRPNLPRYFEYIGNTRAFLVYNKKQFKICDEKQYRHHLRDLELQGQLPRHYLPETNFVVCKVKTRSHNKPRAEFIAISYLTDECMGKLKASSQLKKLMAFAENLSKLEQLPIVIAGTYRLSLEDTKALITPEFRCCGYLPSNKKREVRASSFFICSRTMWIKDVMPIVCSKIELQEENSRSERWLNPEDAFYWDPVIASFVRGYSRANSPTESVHSNPHTPSEGHELAQHTTQLNGAHLNGSAPALSFLTPGAEGASLSQSADDLDGAADAVVRRATSYIELYDEELMESNADIDDDPSSIRQLPIIWKLERIHFLLISLIEELQNVQVQIEKPKVLSNAHKEIVLYDNVWY